MAEQELANTISQKTAQLAIDEIALKKYELAVANGTATTENFTSIMNEASIEAQNYAVSTKGATGSTQTFVSNQRQTIAALKGTEKASLSASLGVKALNIALNAGALLAFSLIVKGITHVIDQAITTLEEQKEKVEECTSAYESAKSELSSVSSELESQTELMDELNSKSKLTYAEQGQLEELKEITKELQLQEDIAKRDQERTKKELAVESVELVNKQFGKDGISFDKINEYERNAELSGNNGILITDENDLSSMIAGYRQFNELLDEAYSSENEDDIKHFKNLTTDISDSIWESIDSLQQQKENIQDYYDTIKDTPYENLTTEEQKIIDSYNRILNDIEIVYSELDPYSWNTIEINTILNTNGIEKTKEELISLAKSGELSPEVVLEYENLYDLIKNSGLIVEGNQTKTEAFCNEIYACAEAESSVNKELGNSSSLLTTLSDKQSKAIEDYKSAISTLGKAFTDIDSTNVSDIMTEFQDYDWSKVLGGAESLSEALQNIAEDKLQAVIDQFDNISNCADILTELRTLFNNAFSYIDELDKAKSSYDELYSVLEKVRNSEKLSYGEITNIITKYNDLAGSVEVLADGYSIEESAIVSLVNTNVEAYNKFLALQTDQTKVALEQVQARIKAYKLEKLEFMGMYDENGYFSYIDGDGKSVTPGLAFKDDQYYKSLIELRNEYEKQLGDYKDTDFLKREDTNKNTSKSESTTSTTSKTFDWLQTKIDAIRTALSRLTKTRDNTYSSWSKRNSALAKEIKKTNRELEVQEKAYQIYLKSVFLSTQSLKHSRQQLFF